MFKDNVLELVKDLDAAYLDLKIDVLFRIKILLEKEISNTAWVYEVNSLDKKYLDKFIKKRIENHNIENKVLNDPSVKHIILLMRELDKIDIVFKTNYGYDIQDYWETFISITKKYVDDELNRGFNEA